MQVLSKKVSLQRGEKRERRGGRFGRLLHFRWFGGFGDGGT